MRMRMKRASSLNAQVDERSWMRMRLHAILHMDEAMRCVCGWALELWN